MYSELSRTEENSLCPYCAAVALSRGGKNRRWRKERKAGRGGKQLIVEVQAQLEWFNWFQSYCLSAEHYNP